MISELYELTKLDWVVLQNSMIVLYRHGIIALDVESGNSTEQACFLRYKLNTESILHRLRFPRYLLFMEARYGKMARLVIFQLMKFGNASVTEIVRNALSDYNSFEGLLANTSKTGKGEVNKHKLKDMTHRLLMDAFLARVRTVDDQIKSAATKPVAAGPLGQPAVKRLKRTSRSSRAPVVEPSSVVVLETPPTVSPDKILSGADELEDGAILAAKFDRINLEIYKHLAEDFIAIRWQNLTVVRMIARAMLRSLRKHGSQYDTQAMGFEEICMTVTTCVEEENDRLPIDTKIACPDSKQLFSTLDSVSRHSDKLLRGIRKGMYGIRFVHFLKDGSSAFQVDWERLRDFLRRRVAKQMIETRFGLSAARIFALILDADMGTGGSRASASQDSAANDTAIFLKYTRFWNDQEVSDQTLVSPTMARRHLMELADSGFLRSHQADVVGAIPPSASANNASLSAKHCYVFGANDTIMLQIMKESLMKTILNIMERKAMEVEKLQKLAMQ